MPTKTSQFNFSKAFQELESVTQWFESEEASDLEKGLKQFERGLELAARLKEQLTRIEGRVEEIKKTFHLETE